MKIPPWIYMDGCEEVICKHCGEVERPRLPMLLEAFLKWSASIGEKHKYCIKILKEGEEYESKDYHIQAE
jgi:hypothetical protein